MAKGWFCAAGHSQGSLRLSYLPWGGEWQRRTWSQRGTGRRSPPTEPPEEKKNQVLKVMTKLVTPLLFSLWAGEHLQGPHSCPALSEIAICQDCRLNQILWGPLTRMQNQWVTLLAAVLLWVGQELRLSWLLQTVKVGAISFSLLAVSSFICNFIVICPPACTCWSKNNQRDM